MLWRTPSIFYPTHAHYAQGHTVRTLIHPRYQISSVYFQICFDIQACSSPSPSTCRSSTWNSQWECTPAVMTASVCGVLRQPAKGGEIAALAPCILGLGVGGWRRRGGLAGVLQDCNKLALDYDRRQPGCVWWGDFSVIQCAKSRSVLNVEGSQLCSVLFRQRPEHQTGMIDIIIKAVYKKCSSQLSFAQTQNILILQ